MIRYRVVRSGRKTVSIQVTRDGEVVVRAPRNCPNGYIQKFVDSKADWIEKHVRTMEHYLDEQASFSPQSMKTIGFCGKQLRVVPGKTLRIDPAGMRIFMPEGSVPELLPELEKAYKQAAYPWLRERMDDWARRMGIDYGQVRFSSALKRWGSCSAKGDIRITWMLMMAPIDAIDYVLVHELAHRRVFDHSAAFWAVVARYMPDYPQQKQVLKSLSETLYAQGWSRKYS